MRHFHSNTGLMFTHQHRELNLRGCNDGVVWDNECWISVLMIVIKAHTQTAACTVRLRIYNP